MAFYVVQHRYTARRDGQTFGPWEGGETVDLSDDEAAWINRDSEGCVELLQPEEPKAREQKPAADRQHRGGRNRGA